MKQKVTKDNWEALIHWNFALVGGFLGVYAILLRMGNFGSAQTGNIMEMAASLVSGEWYDVLLRFLALPLFGGGVVVSYRTAPRRHFSALPRATNGRPYDSITLSQNSKKRSQ